MFQTIDITSLIVWFSSLENRGCLVRLVMTCSGQSFAAVIVVFIDMEGKVL